jgi:hypothetical protein
MKARLFGNIALAAVWFAVFSPAWAETREASINVNLIIDGSRDFSEVSGEASLWISQNLVDILQAGDKITIWSAGARAVAVYSAKLNSEADRDAVKNALKTLTFTGDRPDFAGALREAASITGTTGINYTLLVSGSYAALSPTLLGPQSGLMRFSRVEEFRGWRALVIGLNLDSRVRQAAASFM